MDAPSTSRTSGSSSTRCDPRVSPSTSGADSPWVPYQYYSSTCSDTYGLQSSAYATRDDETRALCTGEYSDLSRCRRQRGLLDARGPTVGLPLPAQQAAAGPCCYSFPCELRFLPQEWVTATAIRIVLTRLNTFGDEIFGDKQVLRSYYYAIADLAVGGRCQCNGHAMACDPGPAASVSCVSLRTNGWRQLRALHGPVQRPGMGRATSTNAHECQREWAPPE
ncbi:hypothetical protein HPB49_012192 [Dermacentor silvarum]|uniref:Uncharacterized protein n=1 Tax=Dermacentor silvarum TaxID=543639 RepID=A0ACB8E028_DERSI|nr:hypothetical protein HPB49_012192 [Dermacentor silvarum]